MTTPDQINGACLCGAVKVAVQHPQDFLNACHCDQCRAWTGAMFMSVYASAENVTITGPVKVFKSSDWAERGHCDTCGSCLYYHATSGGDGGYGISAGLFPDAAGLPLTLEFFADNIPHGYGFAGDHRRLTAAETFALFAPSEGE